MSRQFNTAGPSIQEDHYMLDPLVRIDAEEIESLINDKRYFVLHAPRKTGKTTCLLAMMNDLNAKGIYQTLYVNLESAQTARGDVQRGMRTICGLFESAAQLFLDEDRLSAWTTESWKSKGADGVLFGMLEKWARNSDRPTVLFLDEVDALVGDTLV